MRFSLRTQFTLIIVALLAGMMLVSMLVNRTFLDDFYRTQKITALKKCRESLVGAVGRDEITSDDFDVELVKINNKDNIGIIIMNQDSMTIKSYGPDAETMERRMWDNLLGLTPTREELEAAAEGADQVDAGSSKDEAREFWRKNGMDTYDFCILETIERRDNYVLNVILDRRTSQQSLEMWGSLEDGSYFLMRAPLESIHNSSSLANRFFLQVGLVITAIVAIVPIALATMMEHIGDISAISATVGKNYIADPGLHRTLTGDGLATTIASLFGAPANTTYGENTGVLALTKVYDPKVIRIAACFAAVLSFSPKFAAIIHTIPTATIGGISFVLYGMISAAGLRNMVESHVDFSKSRNLIIAAVILVCALGMTDGLTFHIGSVAITLSALAVGSIAGILLNAILPGKDFVFDESDPHDTGADLSLENVALEKQKKYGEKKAREKAAVKKLKAKPAETE